jgi:glycine/D-amino acid oxidase-like deaminating enzyme
MLKVIPTKNHKVFSTWAIATHPQPRSIWPTGCFIWEAARPYLYMRVSPDNRIICGGEDEEFLDEERRDALLDRKKKALERKLKALFPQVDSRAEFAWCGSFGTSTTGMPTIGAVPKLPNCYISLFLLLFRSHFSFFMGVFYEEALLRLIIASYDIICDVCTF